jgi:hypothetical protein
LNAGIFIASSTIFCAALDPVVAAASVAVPVEAPLLLVVELSFELPQPAANSAASAVTDAKHHVLLNFFPALMYISLL